MHKIPPGGRGSISSSWSISLHVQTFRQEGGGGSIRRGHISCSSVDVGMGCHLR